MLLLTVRKGQTVLQTLELGEGVHLIGRQADCAVVLPDKAVSSVHARIEVGRRDVVVKDMESLNGIYCKGAKVGKVGFSREGDFDIGDFSLHGAFKAAKGPPLFSRQSLPGFRLAVPALCVLASLATLAVFWAAASGAVRQSTEYESLRRGTLLSRSLAEQNVAPLRARRTDQVRVTPVSGEEGVRYAFVADPYGKVLAPAQAIGRILTNPKVAEAARQGMTTLHAGTEGETVLSSPIKDAEGVLGVAVVGYAPASGFAGPSLAGAGFMALAAGVLAALAAAWLAQRSLLRPVRELAEAVGLAVKTGGRSVAVRTPCPELEELRQAAERLLLQCAGGAPAEPAPASDSGPAPGAVSASPSSAVPGSGAVPAQGAADACPAMPDLEALDCPAMLTELEGFRILAWNRAFAPLAAPGVAAPVHLLQGLADPAHLAAVLALLEDPQPEARTLLEGATASVSKRPAGDGRAVFLFEDTRNG